MPHVLVFDSGIGGTSVLSHLKCAMPMVQYTYVMDNELLPYGLQSQETIKSRLTALLNWIERSAKQVDVIVIACNTASTYALETARQHTNIPIVGVVPAIKPAAETTLKKHIGLLATPATSKNTYTANLISTFASECQVDIYHSTTLVNIAEHYYWHNEMQAELLQTELQRLNICNELDRLVLGCTHFPIIKNHLQNYFSHKVELVDSGAAIARRVQHLLKNKLDQSGNVEARLVHWYATASDKIEQAAGVKSLKLVS
ncbi:glutamate racemase [Pseudoalteromonas luteoviolacea]|uniref:Glutamate racemase n=1 Tax=Pseudoalteromonas luteoviolacea TaxID=43657 RepID=A0A1C0TLR9_9GAMM|nr:glutamate racemase [Pseudoalteromonas luteoviolacea]OCQ19582.1 glutamate racemase [Pseudoalteromonas luteoviolacea]